MNAPEPHAMTGVVRPTPLRELSALLGIEIVAVRRASIMRHPTGAGLEQPKAWHVVLGDGRRCRATSREFRHMQHLNAMAAWCGRPVAMAALTSEDGRRALRLMHEALEHDDRNTSTSSINTEENQA